MRMARETNNSDVRSVRCLATVAELLADGHFCVFGFTCNYKACLGTVAGNCDEVLETIPSFDTMEAAVKWAISHPDHLRKHGERG